MKKQYWGSSSTLRIRRVQEINPTAIIGGLVISATHNSFKHMVITGRAHGDALCDIDEVSQNKDADFTSPVL